MGDNTVNENNLPHNQAFDVSIDVHPQGGANRIDGDGRLRPTVTVWTESAHIITALIGSGVLSLPWATAQLGWIVGPTVMFLVSVVTFYASTLLADACYSSGNPVTMKTNFTYMEAIVSVLGDTKFFKICGLLYYMNLYGVVIAYTIESSTTMSSIIWSKSFHNGGDKHPYHMNSWICMIIFGGIQIIFSQTYGRFLKLQRYSINVTVVMSVTYSVIGLGLSIAKVVETGASMGSLTGISIGTVTETQKIWRAFQALGVIAFAYSYSIIFIEIHGTIKSPPSEVKTMKRASILSVGVTTLLYMLCGCFGYAAFGDLSPENLITASGFDRPYWLIVMANLALAIHLAGAYQVYCQPLFAFIENRASERFRDSHEFITREREIALPAFRRFNLELFRSVWRTIFVTITTVISMLLPFSNNGVGLLGALGFWPFTVCFPVMMCIYQKKIRKWSTTWIGLQTLSFGCFIISIAAATGSIAGLVLDLKSFKPFKTAT